MAKLTVPDLLPFKPYESPNLLDGGPYDTTLTVIEDWLGRYLDYIDEQDANLQAQINSAVGRIDTIEALIAKLSSDSTYKALTKSVVNGDI